MKLWILTLLISTNSWANHVVVNCGPQGYVTATANKPGYYVWIMNDNKVQIEKALSNDGWKDLGSVGYGPQAVSILDVPLSALSSDDFIKGQNFSMKLNKEIQKESRKPRRYFNATFSAKVGTEKIDKQQIECTFGLK